MSTLKETLARKIEEHRPRTARLLKEHGDVKLGEVTIAQAIGGARGVRCLVTDTSYLDPDGGHPLPRQDDSRDLRGAAQVPGQRVPVGRVASGTSS